MSTIPNNPSEFGLTSGPKDYERVVRDCASLTIKILEVIDEECDHFNPISVLSALEQLYVQSILENEIPLEIALSSMKEVYKRIKANGSKK